jgi:hypothetical protein
VLSAFVPLSTDFYLPALPGMGGYFHVSVGITNLTLILFFIFFSVGLICLGAWLGISKRNLMIEVREMATITR